MNKKTRSINKCWGSGKVGLTAKTNRKIKTTWILKQNSARGKLGQYFESEDLML